MRPLNIDWCGVVKFCSVKELNNDNYLRTILVQHISDKKQKTNIRVIDFHNEKVLPLQKELYIEFKGYVKENKYLDSTDDTYKSTGLEVVASEVKLMEVFD